MLLNHSACFVSCFLVRCGSLALCSARLPLLSPSQPCLAAITSAAGGAALVSGILGGHARPRHQHLLRRGPRAHSTSASRPRSRTRSRSRSLAPLPKHAPAGHPPQAWWSSAVRLLQVAFASPAVVLLWQHWLPCPWNQWNQRNLLPSCQRWTLSTRPTARLRRSPSRLVRRRRRMCKQTKQSMWREI